MRGQILFLTAPFVILINLTFAQTGRLETCVSDAEHNVPVIGANVVVELPNIGAGTDMTGCCSIDSLQPREDTLTISQIGYYRMLVPFVVKPDTITRIHARLLIALLKYSDGGFCGTPTHGDPPPVDYTAAYSTITYTPILR